MKNARKHFKIVSAAVFAALVLTAGAGCRKNEAQQQAAAGGGEGEGQKSYTIAFSQSTTTEPWRVLFNEKLKKEAANHPNVNLLMEDAQDSTEKQVSQMETFIVQKVDAILVSPKESAGLTSVVERATDAGIPVFVLDRGVNTDKYASFIGGDNMVIGRAAGEHVVNLLGGPGAAHGKVVEIWGGMGSTPAQERHNGFREFVDKEPGIEFVLDNMDGDWKQDKGYNIMETALTANEQIDLVYAHNDPMAYGAYLAAKAVGRENDIMFIGIDAMPQEGCVWVDQGILTATFVYETPGVQGLLSALDHLGGNAVDKKITLPTKAITKENAKSDCIDQ